MTNDIEFMHLGRAVEDVIFIVVSLDELLPGENDYVFISLDKSTLSHSSPTHDSLILRLLFKPKLFLDSARVNTLLFLLEEQKGY